MIDAVMILTGAGLVIYTVVKAAVDKENRYYNSKEFLTLRLAGISLLLIGALIQFFDASQS